MGVVTFSQGGVVTFRGRGSLIWELYGTILFFEFFNIVVCLLFSFLCYTLAVFLRANFSVACTVNDKRFLVISGKHRENMVFVDTKQFLSAYKSCRI